MKDDYSTIRPISPARPTEMLDHDRLRDIVLEHLSNTYIDRLVAVELTNAIRQRIRRAVIEVIGS